MTCFLQLSQGWTKKAERIHCPDQLPEDPTIPLLTKMLVPAPYKVPKKRAEAAFVAAALRTQYPKALMPIRLRR